MHAVVAEATSGPVAESWITIAVTLVSGWSYEDTAKQRCGGTLKAPTPVVSQPPAPHPNSNSTIKQPAMASTASLQ
ncbi:unnamed protein product [Arctogadus glacialis]